jgi:hypothetical protein
MHDYFLREKNAMTCSNCNAPIDVEMQACLKCGAAVAHMPEKTKPFEITFRFAGKLIPWGCAGVFLICVLLGILSNLIPEPSSPLFTGILRRGHEIQASIVQANKIRASLGLPDIWPKSVKASTNQPKDISGNVFKTSTEYFKALFDEENYGTAKWSPYLIDFDYSKLAGAGVQVCTNNQLTAKNNVWVIAANITDQDNDRVPFLITRNLNVKEVERVVNQGLRKEEFTRQVTFSDVYVDPFRDKCFIVISKGDKKPRSFSGKATLGDLFDNKELPPRDPSKPPIVYLMP